VWPLALVALLAEVDQQPTTGVVSGLSVASASLKSATRAARMTATPATAPPSGRPTSFSTPLVFLLSVMRDPKQTDHVRLLAAIAAAPYVHPRLDQIEHIGTAPQHSQALDAETLGLH
jgi:hypothetical protein